MCKLTVTRWRLEEGRVVVYVVSEKVLMALINA